MACMCGAALALQRMAIEVMWIKQARGQALTQVVHELEAAETQGKDWQT